MFAKSVKRSPILFIIVLIVLILVEASLVAQPELPERAQVTVKSYTEIFPELETTKLMMDELGGEIDKAVNDKTELDCQTYYDGYQDIAALPEFDTADADELAQYAGEQYEAAITHFLETSRDSYLQCSNAIETESVAAMDFSKQWGLAWQLARAGIAESVDMLDKAIRRLRIELPDTTDYSGPNGPLLKATKDAVRYIHLLGWQVDRDEIVAREFIEAYEQLQALPEFDASTLDDTGQGNYIRYRSAVDNVLDTSRDIYLSQISRAAQPGETYQLPSLQARLSRRGVFEAIMELDQVVEQLSE